MNHANILKKLMTIQRYGMRITSNPNIQGTSLVMQNMNGILDLASSIAEDIQQDKDKRNGCIK